VTLVQLIEPSQADAAAQATLEAGRAQYGQVLNTWRALAQRPPILNAYLPYLRAVMGEGEVPRRTKDLAALEVAVLNRCRYTVSHRVASARTAGVTDDELDALARDDWSSFPEPEQVALELARELTLRPPVTPWDASPQAVETPLLTRVRRAFREPQIVELAVTISIWNALARFHRVMGFELDMPPPPSTLDDRL
jgi:AhpD family alkylhydroperoxidase